MPDPKELTREQQAALDWLKERGGMAVYKGGGVLMVGSERAPISRQTLKELTDAGVVAMRRGLTGGIEIACL